MKLLSKKKLLAGGRGKRDNRMITGSRKNLTSPYVPELAF